MSIDAKTKYERRLCRQYPGLFVILLDQSGSMSQPIDDPVYKQQTKAQVATAALNTIIYEMIQAPGEDEYNPGVYKKYAYLSVLGYNDSVFPLLTKSKNSDDPIDVPAVVDKSLGTTSIVEYISTRSGRQERRDIRPFWIKPKAEGNTQMASAFAHAKAVVDSWLASPPELISPDMGYQAPRRECFPPVIINITDAQNNGRVNPLTITTEIQQPSNGTNDGNILIFNCHFTKEQGRPHIFPADISEVEHLDPYGLAANMFKMSSPIPESLRENASRIMRKSIAPDARCYVYNANPEALVKFLRWGTRPIGGTGTGGML